MKNFWTRTASATVYALLFLGSIYSGALLGNKDAGLAIFTAFLLFVGCGGTFEFFRIVEKQGARPCKPLGYAYAVGALLVLAMLNYGSGLHGMAGIAVAMTLLPALFGVSAIVQLWGHGEQPFRDAAYTMVPMLYIALPLGLMPMLHLSYNVLVMIILLVWLNDSAAYMGGSMVGKHKMWPRHSPGKTWEGTLIGVAVTMLVAVLVGPAFVEWTNGLVHPAEGGLSAWYHWLALGFICSVIDTLGDLVESMLKRSVGVKDSGNIMPGHGGFLDRFDSLLVVVPFAFAYLIFAGI